MTINQIKEFSKNCKEVLVRKIENLLGNYSFQMINSKGENCIGSFKNYEEAITFFYLECNFTKEQFNGKKFTVLEK